MELYAIMELLKFHIENNHYSYPIFYKFVERLIPSISSSIIIELGIKDNNKSTILFDAIANKYNGLFITSDSDNNQIDKVKLGSRSQIIIENTIMFIYNLITHIKTNDNLKNSKIQMHLNMYDEVNLTEIENANIYLNCYYIAKSLFIPGSQLLVNTNNNETIITILKKEIPVNSQSFNNRYLLFQW